MSEADDKEKYGTLTDAEIDEFDKRAREQFDRSQRLVRHARAQVKGEADPEPGSDEAKELIREAIKQDDVEFPSFDEIEARIKARQQQEKG